MPTAPTPPILPTVGDVIGAAKDRLAAVLPAAEPHLSAGGEWDLLPIGLRGQFSAARAALAGHVVDSHLATATGPALDALTASNFDTAALPDATRSVGAVTLVRPVVHSGPSPGYILVPLPLATDQSTFATLILTISAYLVRNGGHSTSIFDAVTGLGAHVLADSSVDPLLLYLFSGFGTYTAAANSVKQSLNRHFANQRIDTGVPLAIHKDPDTTNTVTVADATSANPAGIYSTATAAELARLFALTNACYAAFLAHINAESRPGTLRSGTIYALAAAPTATPPIQASQYRAVRDTYVRAGEQTATVPVEATATGPAANLPVWSTAPPAQSLTARSTPFDATLLPVAVTAAGGGVGQPDATLVESAAAAWTGSSGPAPAALRAGALRAAGVVRAPLREDPRTGRAWVYPIDASWAQSPRWLAGIEQLLRGTGADDEWLGLGCRLSTGAVINRLVRVELIVQLRSPDFLADSDAVLARVTAVIKDYFDARPDFWAWRLSTLRAVAAGADRRRILTCSYATVRDVAGIPIAEPAEPGAGEALTHWWLDGAPVVDFIAPS